MAQAKAKQTHTERNRRSGVAQILGPNGRPLQTRAKPRKRTTPPKDDEDDDDEDDGDDTGTTINVYTNPPATRAADDDEGDDDDDAPKTPAPPQTPPQTPAQPQQAASAPATRSAREVWLEARVTQLTASEGFDAERARVEAERELEEDMSLRARLEHDIPVGDRQADIDIVSRVSTAVASALAQPENPRAAIAAGLPRTRMTMRERGGPQNVEQVLTEVLAMTLVPQVRSIRGPGQSHSGPSNRQLTRAYNMLREFGISSRALTIEGNGTVIREELARQFVIVPSAEVIGRNLFTSIPMAGVQKLNVPRFDGAGLTFQWNRSSAQGAGSLAAITPSDPVLDTFPLEVTELNGATVVPDSFLEFNAQGTTFTSQILLPQLRLHAQLEEDRKFFNSTGVHPDPATFKGIMKVDGATDVVSSANGDKFDIRALTSLKRAIPREYRNNRRRLAYFIATGLIDDLEDIIADRKTSLGDTFLTGNRPGSGGGDGTAQEGRVLTPVAMLQRIPVYEVTHISENDTQGTATNASTAALVHLDVPVIGDALTLRFEPYRQEGFVTKIQLQEFVGLGYQFPQAIARRSGLTPAEFS